MSNIPDTNEFLSIIAGVGAPSPRKARLATVNPAHSSGDPRVIFDGESGLTVKGYKRLASYTPAANDRVLMLPVGSNSYVIVGKVV